MLMLSVSFRPASFRRRLVSTRAQQRKNLKKTVVYDKHEKTANHFYRSSCRCTPTCQPFCLKSLRVRPCCFPALLMAMAQLAEAWTRTVAGVPLKDFFFVLRLLYVVVAAPLASACHAWFPAFELFVSLVLDVVVSVLVLLLYIVYGFIFLAAVAFVEFAVLLLYPSLSSSWWARWCSSWA